MQSSRSEKEDGNGNVSGSGNGNECKRNGIQPCLPFFNGLIRGLVRSNELPDYIEQMDHSTNKTHANLSYNLQE